ncbi:flagellar hook-length control protein FliK [Sedimentitalea todarodis]|uniref:Flagellar hook-length control protein FliK n=1 Tax=Sedimentitalea todarodis TaxID=1631240 RepID=A0ABU3VA87_9RHOB|nr:flagellar hook-length control protein FliK [Sedimentitalea todarodis]MDU9003083.1 flagellar hook-length control protein FliK [Sedimentitalea todarodis]
METEVNAKETTFASALARMLGDAHKKPAPTEPQSSEANEVDAESSEIEFATIGETDGMGDDTADDMALMADVGAFTAKPAKTVTEHSARQTDPVEPRDERFLTANHADENLSEVAGLPQVSGAEALTQGSPEWDPSRGARGESGSKAQLGEKVLNDTSRARETGTVSWGLPNLHSTKRDVPSAVQVKATNAMDGAQGIDKDLLATSRMSANNVPSPTDTVEKSSENPASAAGMLNEVWGGRQPYSGAKPATDHMAQIGQERVQDVSPATGLDEGGRRVTAPETEAPTGSPAKGTPRPSISQEQISNPLAHGPESMASLFPATETAGLETFVSAGESPDWAPSRSVGATGFAPSVSAETILARPETVRNAAAYAVEIFARESGKTVEIALNPEELGRVRMALSTSDAGVTVLITSERPETLELMRRHIEQLSQEFQKLGYGQASFEFNSDGSSGHDHSQDGGHAATDAANAAGETQNTMPNRLVQSGLDLRL